MGTKVHWTPRVVGLLGMSLVFQIHTGCESASLLRSQWPHWLHQSIPQAPCLQVLLTPETWRWPCTHGTWPPKLVQLFELYRTVQEPSRIAQQPSQFSLLHSFPTFCEECRAAQSKLQAVTNWPDSR